MDFTIFGKMTSRRIHIIKNCSILINIHGEIKEQNQGRKINRKERENTKNS